MRHRKYAARYKNRRIIRPLHGGERMAVLVSGAIPDGWLTCTPAVIDLEFTRLHLRLPDEILAKVDESPQTLLVAEAEPDVVLDDGTPRIGNERYYYLSLPCAALLM